MRTIIRRVAKLEDRLTPREVRTEDKRIMQLAAELRERRRRRMEVMGLPFEETPLPPNCTGPPFDLAKVLRMRPRRPGDQRRDGGDGEFGLRVKGAPPASEAAPILIVVTDAAQKLAPPRCA